MRHLTPIAVVDLRRAAAKLARPGRATGVDRALWLAAQNYRNNRQDSLELPYSIVSRARELAGLPPLEEPAIAESGSFDPNART